MIARHRRTYLVGVGTTYYVAQMAQYYFSALARTFIPVISSDEFRSLAHVDADTLVIAISQSGETYDTLDAIRFAKERGARTAAIVQRRWARRSPALVDHAIIQGSGPEICVVSTKAALGQIVVLLRVAAALGRLSGATDEAETVTRDLRALPDAIQQLLDERTGDIAALAQAALPHRQLALPRARHLLPRRPRVGPEDEGSHVPARRGHAGRLSQARHALAHRQELLHGHPRPLQAGRGAVHGDHGQRRGGQGAGRLSDREPRRRERRDLRRAHPAAQGAAAARPAPPSGRAAALRVLHGRRAPAERGSARVPWPNR